MNLSDARLTEFEEWMVSIGRSPDTAACYRRHLVRCGKTPSLTTRVISRSLSPNTRHLNHAALSAWARFSEDGALSKHLKEIRLPPARRVGARVELDRAAWEAIVKAIDRNERTTPAMKAILFVMALRGLRSGDVLRLRRRDLEDALATGTLSYTAKGDRRLEYDVTPIRAQLEALLDAAPYGAIGTDRAGAWKEVRDLIALPTTSAKDVSQAVRRALARCAKGAKLSGVYPHRLRRTYASHFIRRLQNDPQALVKLAKHMGWAGIGTAAQYTDAVNRSELDQIGADLVGDLLPNSKPPSKRR